MRVDDLRLEMLLSCEPEDGLVRFAGERALIVDAVAFGLLRRELIESVGAAAARCILTRHGYAHGRRTAQAMQSEFPWDSMREWQLAGPRLHMLQGLVVVRPVPDADRPSAPFAECLWQRSYEAEQHRLQVGPSDEPVCWSLCGFASGYLSYSSGREVLCIETACVGRGDATCRLEGRPLEDWGEEGGVHRAYYDTRAVDGLLDSTVRALKRTEEELARRNAELKDATAPSPPREMVARSAPMRRTVELAHRIAQVDTTALIRGPSGAGKERIARYLHRASARRDGPFVAVHCGAIAESLLESELFGHVRGAFTGATRDRAGLFEAADGGTLLLDEVGEIAPAVQVKLLRVLQEREVRRVGESRVRSLDVRVLAATHRDLAELVATGAFREDLYYRLRVIELPVPALAERRDDVLELAQSFLQRAAARFGKALVGFSPGAADRLLRHGWPGNVRELENAVEHAAVLTDGPRIEVADLPPELRGEEPPGSEGRGTLQEVERRHILAALESNGGHRERTARELGIGPATLYRKLKRYGIT